MHIYTDGSSRGNPGEAACACIFVDGENNMFDSECQYLGEATNNEAEYHGIILALETAVGVHRGPLVLLSDSQLVVRQLNGSYRVKAPNLIELYDEAVRLKNRYDEVEINYVPRENPLLSQVDEICERFLDDMLGVA